MKNAKYIILIAMAVLMCACGSKRKVVATDPIYDTATEDYIFAELAESLKNQPKGESQALLREALSWRGVPYVYGGESKKGVDCSGFVMKVYKDALGILLPRTSAEQGEFAKKVKVKNLKIGDLLFFHTSKKSKKINHVGMYVGNGNMIHASSSQGVVIVSFYNQYFQDHFSHAGRIL